MLGFQVVETFTAAPLNLVSGISDMELVVQGGKVLLYSATRAGGGIMALEVGASMSLIGQENLAPGMTLPAEATVETLTINGTTHLVVTGANHAGVHAYAIGSGGGLAATLQLPGSLTGTICAQTVVSSGAATYFYAARAGESTIHAYSIANDGSMTPTGTTILDGAHSGIDISALAPVRVGGQTFLVSLSLEADVVRAFPVGVNGALGAAQSMGVPQGLGHQRPLGHQDGRDGRSDLYDRRFCGLILDQRHRHRPGWQP